MKADPVRSNSRLLQIVVHKKLHLFTIIVQLLLILQALISTKCSKYICIMPFVLLTYSPMISFEQMVHSNAFFRIICLNSLYYKKSIARRQPANSQTSSFDDE